MIKNQSGNVLFYILIAVMLLAALSYTVAQTNRGGAQSISRERASIAASEIIEYGNILSNAVTQIRLRGHNDTEVSFDNLTVSGYTNANCLEDGCKIFDINGGGVVYIQPKPEWLDTGFSANAHYGDMNFSGTSCTEGVMCFSDGIDNEDLIAYVPFIKKDICLAINDRLDITNPSGDAPVDSGCSGAAATKFVGAYSQSTSLKDLAGYINKSAGCYKHDAGCAGVPNSYHYYQVLVER